MDENKDEPVKCFKIGEAALKVGDRTRALKFINKARRLDFKLVNHPAWDLLFDSELEEEKDISYGTVQPQMKKTEVTLAEKRHARFIHEEYKEKIWVDRGGFASEQ
ncbi:hypothetical protein C5167_033928 [Papaver somniferum]|uniref:Uncharacterized protein n=1 Tax=Papaver somniferum TaxID=3469 RepID=A0A4Y7KD37_PAPSO|nr:hypothetical protein C5167_033928 [Papaver somniferum]